MEFLLDNSLVAMEDRNLLLLYIFVIFLSVPTDRVVQLHFVGSRKHGRQLIDAHADRTEDEIWNVFGEVCVRCDIKGAILERDEDFPDFGELVSELETARSIMSPALAGM